MSIFIQFRVARMRALLRLRLRWASTPTFAMVLIGPVVSGATPALRRRVQGGGEGQVVIDNEAPLLDTLGHRLPAADGALRQGEDGRFWLYTAVYNCSGTPGPTVCPDCAWYGTAFAAYSSADLSPRSWRLESPDIFPDRNRGRWPSTNTTYAAPPHHIRSWHHGEKTLYAV